MMDIFMAWMPLIMLAAIILYPFWALAQETYKAVYNTNKVPVAHSLLHFIPFYNYIVTRKYLYNKALSTIVMTCLTLLCFVFRTLAIVIWGTTDPWMMVVSVYVAITGVILWYLTMGWTALSLSLLTKRGIFTIILSVVLPPFGAFIVSKNIRKYFASIKEEIKDEFAGDYN